MIKKVYYAKSFEEDFCTKTLVNKKKVTFQSAFDIVRTKTIRRNTKSFGKKRRLSCSILHKKYLRTYRPQGIIFQTAQKPSEMFPFDLTVVAATKDIIVHYYRIKNKLHIYYSRKLIPGFEKFKFKQFSLMIKKYPSPKNVWKDINRFRKKNRFNVLPKQKYRLVEYNEAIFYKDVKIKPIALFGYRKETIKIAEKLNLPHYISAKHFFNSIKNL